MKYKNKKTGGIYELLDHALNTTNDHDGQAMIIYAKEGNYSNVFVRETKEFNEKFEPLEQKATEQSGARDCSHKALATPDP